MLGRSTPRRAEDGEARRREAGGSAEGNGSIPLPGRPSASVWGEGSGSAPAERRGGGPGAGGELRLLSPGSCGKLERLKVLPSLN